MDEVMASRSLPCQCRGKSYDLRPLIEKIELIFGRQNPHEAAAVKAQPAARRKFWMFWKSSLKTAGGKNQFDF